MDIFSIVLLTHRIAVTLFLLHYVLKLILLLTNKETLATYTKKTMPIEIAVSVLFLVTGIWLLVGTWPLTTLIVIKLICVFSSIPIAVIGFRKGKKALAVFAILLILGAYGLGEADKKQKMGKHVDTTDVTGGPIAIGQKVYDVNCTPCHGVDGKLGLSGAKDLSVTTLTVAQQKEIIKNGNNGMPAYKDKLTEEQLDGLTQYIATLKK